MLTTPAFTLSVTWVGGITNSCTANLTLLPRLKGWCLLGGWVLSDMLPCAIWLDFYSAVIGAIISGTDTLWFQFFTAYLLPEKQFAHLCSADFPNLPESLICVKSILNNMKI